MNIFSGSIIKNQKYEVDFEPLEPYSSVPLTSGH